MADRILGIEDAPSILRGLPLNLGREGYTGRSAMDGTSSPSAAVSHSQYGKRML